MMNLRNLLSDFKGDLYSLRDSTAVIGLLLGLCFILLPHMLSFVILDLPASLFSPDKAASAMAASPLDSLPPVHQTLKRDLRSLQDSVEELSAFVYERKWEHAVTEILAGSFLSACLEFLFLSPFFFSLCHFSFSLFIFLSLQRLRRCKS